jgi:tetratricopeptide (TPR) repeat protein
MIPLRSAVLVLALALALGGCNAFSFQDDAPGDSPDELLESARAAMDAGDVEKAVDYLERAHDTDPEHAAVRVELAAALFAAEGIDALTLQQAAENLSGSVESATDALTAGTSATGASSKYQRSSNLVCTDGADPIAERYIRVELATVTGVEIFLLSDAVLGRIAGLISDDFVSSKRFNRLEASLQGKGLLAKVVTEVATALVQLDRIAAEFDVNLYRTRDDVYLVCAPDDNALVTGESSLCSTARTIEVVRKLLVQRNRVIGTDPNGGILLEPLGRLLSALKGRVVCSI